jgi:hypothetical protein
MRVSRDAGIAPADKEIEIATAVSLQDAFYVKARVAALRELSAPIG